MLEGETVFNEGSSDIDFRVEGNADTHALFVNAGSDVVSFGGMQSDSRYFSGLIPKLQADALTRMDASIGLTCNSNDTLSPMIMFGKTRGAALNGTTVAAAGDAIGSIVFNPSDGTANLNAMGHTAAAIDAAVGTGIGTNDVPGILRFYTNAGGESSTERMRISDVNGFVSMGNTLAETFNVSSGYADLAIGKGSGDNAGMTIYSGTSHGGGIAFADGTSGTTTYRGLIQYSHASDLLGFYTSATSRMEINSTGSISMSGLSSGAGNADLRYNTGNGDVTYDTSSRLVKENIEDIPYGLEAVKNLSPKKYKRTDGGKEVEVGFIADEVVEVVPELVGMMAKSVFTKEESDTDEIAGSVNYSKMTAVLVKAVQEQQTLIETLQTKVAALEGA